MIWGDLGVVYECLWHLHGDFGMVYFWVYHIDYDELSC